MTLFTVSCVQRDAGGEDGSTTVVDRLPLRDALRLIPALPCASAAHSCTEPSDSVPEHARWISFHFGPSFRDGTSWEVSLHFPRALTPATRGRLVRLLAP